MSTKIDGYRGGYTTVAEQVAYRAGFETGLEVGVKIFLEVVNRGRVSRGESPLTEDVELGIIRWVEEKPDERQA